MRLPRSCARWAVPLKYHDGPQQAVTPVSGRAPGRLPRPLSGHPVRAADDRAPRGELHQQRRGCYPAPAASALSRQTRCAPRRHCGRALCSFLSAIKTAGVCCVHIFTVRFALSPVRGRFTYVPTRLLPVNSSLHRRCSRLVLEQARAAIDREGPLGVEAQGLQVAFSRPLGGITPSWQLGRTRGSTATLGELGSIDAGAWGSPAHGRGPSTRHVALGTTPGLREWAGGALGRSHGWPRRARSREDQPRARRRHPPLHRPVTALAGVTSTEPRPSDAVGARDHGSLLRPPSAQAARRAAALGRRRAPARRRRARAAGARGGAQYEGIALPGTATGVYALSHSDTLACSWRAARLARVALLVARAVRECCALTRPPPAPPTRHTRSRPASSRPAA